jgi:tetratricopeptide (TPR) repeat protein
MTPVFPTFARSPLFFSAILAAFCLFYACSGDSKKLSEAAQAVQQDPEMMQLNQLLESNPNNDTLLYRRALLYYRLDGYDEALLDVGKAIQIDSSKAPYYHLMADVLLDYGRPNDSKRAIEVLKTATRKFPNRLSTLLKLSEFQLIVRKHGDALETLNQVLLRDPQNAEAYFMSGRVALDKADTLNAIASMKKSVQLNADNVDAWIFLGRIYSTKNNPQAIQYFDNALRVDSTSLEAREFKAAFYKRQGQFDQAFSIYRDIITRNPDYANAYFDMGMIYLEQDSLDKAYAHFDLATKTDVLFVDAFYYRGLSSELKGNPVAALADYKQAYKMNPTYEEAKAAKERLEKAGVKDTPN